MNLSSPDTNPAYDSYHKLLGIPRHDQPPTLYRLLGIENLETDRDVIDAAANKQMTYLQSCCNGAHAGEAERLLNEVAGARLRLLNPNTKSQYDNELRGAAPTAPAAASAPLSGTAVTDQPSTLPAGAWQHPVLAVPHIRVDHRERKKRSGSMRWLFAAFVPSLVTLVVAWKMGLISGNRPARSVAERTSNQEPSRQSQFDQDRSDLDRTDRQPSDPGLNSALASVSQPSGVATDPALRPSLATPKASALPIRTQPAAVIPAMPSSATNGPSSTPDPASARIDEEERARLEAFRSMSRGVYESGTGRPSRPASDLPSGGRVAMPSGSELETGAEQVRDLFGLKIEAAKTSHEKQHLATQIYQLALETDQPAPRYALLQMSARLFTEASDLAGVMLVDDTIEARYETLIFEDRIESFTKLVPLLHRPLDQIAAADRGEQMIARAMRFENDEAAIEIANVCKRLASELKNIDMAKKFGLLIDDANALKKAQPMVIAARERLRFEPDNVKANEYLGRFLCFAKSDWTVGLPLLAKSENSRLVELAEAELQSPRTADAKETLAAKWWELSVAADKDPVLSRQSQERSVHWYRQAIGDGLSGLPKAAAQARIDEHVSEQASTAAIRSVANADLRVPAPPRGVPSEAIAFNGNWYLFSSRPLACQDAVAMATGMGGRLVVVRSQAEHDFLLQHARRPLLLGMILRDGVWYDSLGEKQYFFLWGERDGEPNGGASEPFAAINDYSEWWADYPQRTMHFAIEWGKE